MAHTPIKNLLKIVDGVVVTVTAKEDPSNPKPQSKKSHQKISSYTKPKKKPQQDYSYELLTEYVEEAI